MDLVDDFIETDYLGPMLLTIIKNGENGVELISGVELHKDLFEDSNVLWIDVKVESEDDFDDFGRMAGYGNDLIGRLKTPGQTYRLQAYKDYLLLDVHVFHPDSISTSIFFTMVSDDRMITSFNEFGISTFSNFVAKLRRISMHKQNTSDLLAYLFNHVIDDDLSYARDLIARIDRFSDKILAGFNLEDSDMISQYKEEVEQFEAILEDQYLSIGLIPDMTEFSANSETSARIVRIASHIEHIQKMMERAEDKLDFIVQQYQGDVQERTNRRINTLTIVQAIFVPLTFIAGIYGMNFIRMPELEWSNGYFYALGVMGLIAIGELLIFWRSGWFK